MGHIPVLKPPEVVRLLERLGFVEVRQRGSHKQYRHQDGPIIRGKLDTEDGLVSMTMGVAFTDNDWESSLHILVPRKNLSTDWKQSDLEKGAVMKWTGIVQTGIVHSTWLIVDPIQP
jgi:hypothetical protein